MKYYGLLLHIWVMYVDALAIVKSFKWSINVFEWRDGSEGVCGIEENSWLWVNVDPKKENEWSY